MPDTTVRPRDADAVTGLQPAWTISACQALRPGMGNAAAWMWLSEPGLGASTSTGTSA